MSPSASPNVARAGHQMVGPVGMSGKPTASLGLAKELMPNANTAAADARAGRDRPGP